MGERELLHVNVPLTQLIWKIEPPPHPGLWEFISNDLNYTNIKYKKPNGVKTIK